MGPVGRETSTSLFEDTLTEPPSLRSTGVVTLSKCLAATSLRNLWKPLAMTAVGLTRSSYSCCRFDRIQIRRFASRIDVEQNADPARSRRTESPTRGRRGSSVDDQGSRPGEPSSAVFM